MINDQNLSGAPVENEVKCNVSTARVVSPLKCLECRDRYYCETRVKMKEYADLNREDRIEKLILDVHEWDIDASIHQEDYKAVLEKMLKFEIAGIERDFQKRQIQNKPLMMDSFSPPTKFKKFILDGTASGLGEIIGKFAFSAKNIKGNQLFKSDCVTLAKFICHCCVSVDRKPFKYTTLLKSLGQGRKLALEEEKIRKTEVKN